jgi:hypothetical protein
MIVPRKSQPVNAGKRCIGMQSAHSGYEGTYDDRLGWRMRARLKRTRLPVKVLFLQEK